MSSSAQPAVRRPQQTPHTFRRIERIARKADFTDLIKNGKKFSTQDILFYSRKNDLPYTRFGVAAPKRLGSAPLRNRCKRRLRELFRTNKGAVTAGYDIIAVVARDVSRKDFETVRNEFMEGIGRL